jgi:hypothetical protein
MTAAEYESIWLLTHYPFSLEDVNIKMLSLFPNII